MIKPIFLSLALGLALASCNMDNKTDQKTPVVSTTNEPVFFTNENNVIKDGKLTPEVLWMFGRISDVSVSPDGKQILYSVAWTNLAKNKSYHDLQIKAISGGDAKYVTQSSENESSAVWIAGGKKVAYLSDESGSNQLYELELSTNKKRQVSSIEGGIDGFKYSPDESRIIYIKGVVRSNVKEKYPDLPLANVREENDLMYRHWNEWLDKFEHVFIAENTPDGLKNDKDIMEGEHWESPVRPWGGIEQVIWTPDGSGVIYCCRKKEGKEYALSTNTDLYWYHLGSGKTENISESNKGYDLNPSFSPDGKKLVWESMERDGYESDVNRLAEMDFPKGKIVYHNFEGLNVSHINWAKDSKMLYFISDWHATDNIYSFTLGKKNAQLVAADTCDYKSVEDAGEVLITSRQSMVSPTEIFSLDKKTGKSIEISFVNKKLMAQIKMPKVEKRMIKTFDNKDMLTWVVYPSNFDSSKKYPALLYCQGGPQDPVSQFFSYRWNFALMAENGYIIVAPNRRGLPGFGAEWNEEISGDYGGNCMKDYLSAIDDVSKEPFINKNKLGCIGASFGGYSVYWLAGHHQKRFKCFLSHCGIFNFESMYLSTDEMFFVNWELKGNYWDKSNAAAQKSFAESPSNFVKDWDTPIMCITGANDFRIPYTQTLQAFQAARLRGIDARLLFFPEECHWVMSPQNGVVWHREFFEWLDKYLK